MGVFSKKDKDKDAKEKILEAELASLRQEVPRKDQRIQELQLVERSLRQEVQHKDQRIQELELVERSLRQNASRPQLGGGQPPLRTVRSSIHGGRGSSISLPIGAPQPAPAPAQSFGRGGGGGLQYGFPPPNQQAAPPPFGQPAYPELVANLQNQVREYQQRLSMAQAELQSAHSGLASLQRERQQAQDRVQEMEFNHTLAVSQLQGELDDAKRLQRASGLGPVAAGESLLLLPQYPVLSFTGPPPTPSGTGGPISPPTSPATTSLTAEQADEQRALLESAEVARYEERVRTARAERDAAQDQARGFAEEAGKLREDLDAKNRELFVKDNRLEWMQQRAAQLAKGGGAGLKDAAEVVVKVEEAPVELAP